MTELANGERAANGFIDRILFVMTKANIKPRWNEETVREDLDCDWENVLKRLLSMPCNLNANQEPQPVIIRFGSEAINPLYAWQHRNDDLCDNEMRDNVISFFCRLEIYVLRFCLIVRMARWAVPDLIQSPEIIEANDVNGAIRLA